MQAARDLVGAVIELTACMEHGHNDLGRRAPLFGVDIHRNTPPVVGHGDGFVGVDGDRNAVAVPRQGLIDGVVYDLKHHVVETRSIVGVADVHPGSFAHCIKTL